MTKHKALAENPDVPILGFTQAGWPGMFLDWGAPPARAGMNTSRLAR